MKKVLGILFLLIIAAAGICAYFFPGIPYYYKSKHEFEVTDSIWYEIPEDIPELSSEYADYSALGVRITAWNDMEGHRTDNKDNAVWQSKDGSRYVDVYCEHLSESEDFLDRTGITHEALDKYCKKAEKTTPENTYEFLKLIATVTMEDFDIHDFKNAKTFYQLMSSKNEMCTGAEDNMKIYSVDGVGYRGYLTTIHEVEGEGSTVVNIYPEKDKRTRYIITISLTDPNEVLAVAESIKLT